MATENYTAVIEAELIERRKRNPAYSLRSFAKFLGVSPASLSQILSGKRKLSPKIAALIAERCEFPTTKKSEFMSQVLGTNLRAEEVCNLEFKTLGEEEFSKIQNWYHHAIIALAKIPSNQADPHWIAARLKISEPEAREALENLSRHRFVEVRDGRLYPGGPMFFTTVPEVPSPIRRQHQRQLMQKASESLDAVDMEKRDISSVTLAVDPEKLPQAKEIIRKFRRELSSVLSSGDVKQVYTLQISLFPISNG